MDCAFTIVAKNYLGLAVILRKSFLKHNNIPFYIVIADEVDFTIDELGVLIAKDCLNINTELWNEITLKYDLTEFCTSIKPKCFKYFLNELGFSKVLYFDPDILFFNDIDYLLSLLDSYEMVLTPHISFPQKEYTGDLKENQFLGSGVFNLGFCALRISNNINLILDWWDNRLMSMCYSDVYEYLYTDQHWMDLMPCFLGERLFVLRNIGYNLAPWNFFEREVIHDNECYKVKKRETKDLSGIDLFPLVFVHYSGYNYDSFLKGNYMQKNIPNILQYPDVILVLDEYKNSISTNLDIYLKYIKLDYSYSFYKDRNKTVVNSFQRRLFREYIKTNSLSENPFFDSENSFYSYLKKNKLLSRNNKSDKVTISNVKGLDKKVFLLNMIFVVIFKIFGYNIYIYIIKAMRYFSRYENHSFLLRRK